MPCYNLDAFIDESLESLKNQTSQDFQLIIADDASPNSTAAKKLQSLKDAGYEVYFEKKNLGLIKISNKYMSLLDTKYIMLLSPEDTLEPTFIEKSVEYLKKNRNKAAVCTWIQQFGDYTEVIKYSEDTCKLPEMLVNNYYSGAAVINKESWIAAGKHDTDPGLYPNLDYDLWLSMLRRGEEFGVIHEALFNWRSMKSSLSHNVDIDKQTNFKKTLIHKYNDLYTAHAEYTLNHYLDLVSKYQQDYLIYEEGHQWLDTEYKRLLEENQRLHSPFRAKVSSKMPKGLKDTIRKIRKH